MITTAGIARNGEGALFVAKRKPSKNLSSCWEFPGGKAKPGESPREALRREYREEFGVEIEVGELLCTGSFENKSTEFTLMAYGIKLLGTPECREHSECGWKRPEEVFRLRMVPSDKIILDRLELK